MHYVKRIIKRLLIRIGVRSESEERRYAGVRIGPNTYYARRNLDGIAPQLITIGSDCILAPTAMILTHDASSFIHTGKYRFAPVVIGNRCFLGYNAVVMPGVTIGDNAIIGAGAVVTRDVPSGAVVAGVPARIIGQTTDVVEKWKNELVAPPYRFGVSPSAAQLEEFQQRALAAQSSARAGSLNT